MRMPVRSKITRRELAASASVAAALVAQGRPANAQQPLPLPQNPEEELKAARDQIHQNAAVLAKFDIPVATEPASHFKA
jgi:hypothetical protein